MHAVTSFYTLKSLVTKSISNLFNNKMIKANITYFFPGERKGRNEFAEWHVAWLAEWHNYAEFNLWKMKHARVSAAPFLAPIWRNNRFAGPFIAAIKVAEHRVVGGQQ